LVLFLAFHFAYAFAFTYAYTLEAFRGAGAYVMIAAGVLAGLPALLRPVIRQHEIRSPLKWFLLGVEISVVVAIFAVSMWGISAPGEGSPKQVEKPTLRLATYNIHYGYDEDWRFTLEEIARTIEENDVDVVFLQEVDAGRPTSLMVDDALWLGHRLDMDRLFLPCVERLTGIAVLTRIPVSEWETLLLPSDLEQTGLVWLQAPLEGNDLYLSGTWLGLQPEERAQQLEAALEIVGHGNGPEVFAGDLNAHGDAAVYQRLIEAGFRDPWVDLGLEPPLTDPAGEPRQRSDYIWLRGLEPVAVWVSPSLASDHRMVIVEVRLP
jgi:endonuclease/exonuclease/phosphatase family metal-dependent hydrolase